MKYNRPEGQLERTENRWRGKNSEWKGPTKGGRKSGPSGSDRGGTTGTPRTLPHPPRPAVHKICGLPTARPAAGRTTGNRHLAGRNWAPIVPRGYLNEPTREPLAEQATQIGGARPPRCRLRWFHDRGRENPSICAAAERWPLRAAKWPRPLRLWTPTCPAAGFSATAAATPTHGTRRRRDRSSGRISGISAGSGLDYPLQQQ